ncbi:DUF1673 domain-containing protein [Methanosarcina sp. WH1]|uniref:DUF1673 domain-containing protein n=1 Tax=Methanosarcina sp. WH1 TaxID=1434102 RepID=UPI00061543C7|nr:DUF1673 domain-containing protein [Methanosarcina sp. WH1]AKB23304.1 hypothetical protein MSWH1_3033 [Methanosarcina sp. WH1]
MDVFAKSIRKLMGWCPNAKIAEAGSWISPANFEAYDQSEGKKARSPEVPSQFSRLDVRLLMPTLFLTPFYIIMLFLKGVDSDAFCLGILLSLLTYSLCWKKVMQQYDAIAKKPIVDSSPKIELFFASLSIIMFLLLPPMVFLSYIPSYPNAQSLYSFIAGPWILTMWGTSLQLVYWEKKNHMRIHMKNENGFQKTYTIGEKEEEL